MVQLRTSWKLSRHTPVSQSHLKGAFQFSAILARGALMKYFALLGAGLFATACGEVIKPEPDAMVSQQRTLTVTPTSGGTITSSPAGIDCGTTCSASFVDGSQITLTATGAMGNAFMGWSGACSGT